MNKKHLILLLGFLAVAPLAIAREFILSNRSGYQIVYRLAPAAAKSAPEYYLPDTKEETLDAFNSYSIRRSGVGSSYTAYFYDVPVDKIQESDPYGDRINEIPVIVIESTYTGWAFKLEWRPLEQKQPKQMLKLELGLRGNELLKNYPAEIQEYVKYIMSGKLGENYGQKAKEILDYDYTASDKKGLINLAKALLKAIERVTTDIYEKEFRRQKPFISPGKETEEELKREIDMLYRGLQKRVG